MREGPSVAGESIGHWFMGRPCSIFTESPRDQNGKIDNRLLQGRAHLDIISTCLLFVPPLLGHQGPHTAQRAEGKPSFTE